MFTPKELALERGWPGRIEGDKVIQLAAQTLQAFFTGGGSAREHAEYALADVDLLPPVHRPPTVRDFMAFEEHVATARRQRGAEVPKEWYEVPVFYFSNPVAIFGPDEVVPYPVGTDELDYELECAAMIGADGAIGGFTIMNDWSARDLQRQEMRVGLGPAKGKDFATSLGPVLVTPDEFDGSAGTMIARVNGEERSRGELARPVPPLGRAAGSGGRNTVLRPGDVIGSGTVGTGCILEHGDGRWLQRGDVVELEIEGIGVLRNTVAVIGPDDVRAAARVLDGVAHRTPVIASRTLGEQVVLKPECLQRAGAFKFRGAFNKISSLPKGTPVLAYSSGNHAQAVALAARLLGASATILMPEDAPRSKVDATRGYGAEIVTYDRYTEDREALGAALAAERGLELVRPYDDTLVMAGAGTAALELIEDAGVVDTLVVPVGGGGLIAGSATIAKDAGVRRVVGVEPEAGDDWRRSFAAGEPVADRRAAHDRGRAADERAGEADVGGRLAARRRDRHGHRC